MTTEPQPLTTKEATQTANGLEVLKKYVPADHPDPSFYIEFVSKQVLGVDKQGKPRPFWDLFYYLNAAKKTGLDPIMRQLYGVYRWDTAQGKEKMTLQTSIDGLRLIAQRSGVYGGQDDTVFEFDKTGKPLKATVTVYRINTINGERMPTTATAYYDEYLQKKKDGQPMGLWGLKPRIMLSKCAEALALRKAFPQEMTGIYSEEEMGGGTDTGKLVLPKPEKREEVPTSTQPSSGVAATIIKKKKTQKVADKESHQQFAEATRDPVPLAQEEPSTEELEAPLTDEEKAEIIAQGKYEIHS